MTRVPVVRRHLLDGAVAEDAGVVDQDVEPAGGRDDALHQRLDGVVVADVGVEDVDGAPVPAQRARRSARRRGGSGRRRRRSS